jgi:hypothetical protein
MTSANRELRTCCSSSDHINGHNPPGADTDRFSCCLTQPMAYLHAIKLETQNFNPRMKVCLGMSYSTGQLRQYSDRLWSGRTGFDSRQ